MLNPFPEIFGHVCNKVVFMPLPKIKIPISSAKCVGFRKKIKTNDDWFSEK